MVSARTTTGDPNLARCYTDAEEARALASKHKGYRPYKLQIGDKTGIFVARSADFAKSQFFDFAGGECETISKTAPRVSVSSLRSKREGLALALNSMTSTTEEGQAQRANLEKLIAELDAEIGKLTAASQAKLAAAPAPAAPAGVQVQSTPAAPVAPAAPAAPVAAPPAPAPAAPAVAPAPAAPAAPVAAPPAPAAPAAPLPPPPMPG